MAKKPVITAWRERTSTENWGVWRGKYRLFDWLKTKPELKMLYPDYGFGKGHHEHWRYPRYIGHYIEVELDQRDMFKKAWGHEYKQSKSRTRRFYPVQGMSPEEAQEEAMVQAEELIERGFEAIVVEQSEPLEEHHITIPILGGQRMRVIRTQTKWEVR